MLLVCRKSIRADSRDACRVGSLYKYTSFTSMLNGWYGILAWLSILVYSVISGKHIGKCGSSVKGKNFFSSTCRANVKLSTP